MNPVTDFTILLLYIQLFNFRVTCKPIGLDHEIYMSNQNVQILCQMVCHYNKRI